MGQTNGICSHLDHNSGIFIVMHLVKCISSFGPVLVSAYSFQFQMLAIQEETFLRIHMIITQAQRLYDPIDYFALGEKGYLGLIDERIFAAIP